MNLIPVEVPAQAFPRKDPEHPCECENREHDLTFKTGMIFWAVEPGTVVKQGDLIASYEVEKKTFDILALASGVLCEQCVASGDEVGPGAIIGYIRESFNSGD